MFRPAGMSERSSCDPERAVVDHSLPQSGTIRSDGCSGVSHGDTHEVTDRTEGVNRLTECGRRIPVLRGSTSAASTESLPRYRSTSSILAIASDVSALNCTIRC